MDEFKTEQKKRRKAVKRIALPTMSFCLVAALGIGAWQGGLLHKEPEAAFCGGPETETSGAPAPSPDWTIQRTEIPEVFPVHPILKPGDEGYIDPGPEPIRDLPENELSSEPAQTENAPETVTDNTDGQKGAPEATAVMRWWKNKLSVTGALYYALEDNPGSVFSVLATYRPTTANITDFIHEGKTLSEWATEAFAKDASEDAMRGYKLAYNAYLEVVMPEAVSALSENGIECSRADYQNNGIMLSVTAEELENLPLEDLQHWYFDLASDGTKG